MQAQSQPIAKAQEKSGTLVLTSRDIARAMDIGDYIAAVENGFSRLAAGGISLPPVVHLAATGGAFHVKSAGFNEAPHYVAVKVNGNFPDNPRSNGLPTIQGVITLSDGQNGYPLAILDSTEVTAQRTAAATAVAAKYLARPDSTVATIIGCGVQGRVQLRAMLHLFALQQVYAFDVDAESCRKYALEMSAETGVQVEALEDFSQGTLASQLIVTCTSARKWFLGQDHVAPGTFIAAVGADNSDKQELDPRLVVRCQLVVDVLEQCAQIGELHHVLDVALMNRTNVYAELAEIVSGKKPGRTSADQSFVFDSTGSALQDVAAAGMIYERARENQIGTTVALG